MKICHVCGFECADTDEMCPICGAELSAEAEETVEELEIVIEHPVLAASVDDVITAEIFKDMLKSSGIAFSCGEAEYSMKVTFGGGFAAEDIFVDEADLETAQKIYDEVLNSEPQFDEAEFEEEYETEE